MRRYSFAAVVALLAATMPAACATEGGSGPSLSVSSPTEGATVTVPFTLKLVASVALGNSSTGNYHVHLYFDDRVNDYSVIESTTYEVTKAPAGAHVMHLSLRNANHSAAGSDVLLALVIGGSGATDASPSPTPKPSASPSATDDPYKFDY